MNTNNINLKEFFKVKKPTVFELPKDYIPRTETCPTCKVHLVEKIGYTSRTSSTNSKEIGAKVEKYQSVNIHCPTNKEIFAHKETPPATMKLYAEVAKTGGLCSMVLKEDFDVSVFHTKVKNNLKKGTIVYAFVDKLKTEIKSKRKDIFKYRRIFKIKDGHKKDEGWTKGKTSTRIFDMWDEFRAVSCTVSKESIFSTIDWFEIPLDHLELPKGF